MNESGVCVDAETVQGDALPILRFGRMTYVARASVANERTGGEIINT